ncbi:hypothetical protein M5K25_004708 [Dendrobium thyrsiflorum]|uniref:Uncharacterized protein n=1 Tax=Dendrobium thyrsiflorum TaxID=117978 RepID=A0ABD0VG35_DENTH
MSVPVIACWNIRGFNSPNKAICTTAEEAKVNFSFVDNAVKWKGLNKYNFSNFMEGFYYSFADCQWANSVWHKNSILRYSVFGWLALVGGLKMAVELSRRNIQVDLEYVLSHAGMPATRGLWAAGSCNRTLFSEPAASRFSLTFCGGGGAHLS